MPRMTLCSSKFWLLKYSHQLLAYLELSSGLFSRTMHNSPSPRESVLVSLSFYELPRILHSLSTIRMYIYRIAVIGTVTSKRLYKLFWGRVYSQITLQLQILIIDNFTPDCPSSEIILSFFWIYLFTGMIALVSWCREIWMETFSILRNRHGDSHGPRWVLLQNLVTPSVAKKTSKEWDE